MADGHLCLVCLRAGLGAAEVAGALRIPLPPAGDEEPAFLEAVAAFLIASRIPAGLQVTLGVPRSQFLLRRFETPKVASRSLPELVGFEMERHLPGKREEFLCGWSVEGRTAGGGYRVLLGAARRQALERPLALLRRANLAPASIQPETFALAAALRRVSRESRDALLVDLGADTVGIDFIRDGRPAFSRTIPVEDRQWREHGADGEAAEAGREVALRLAARLAAQIGSPLFRESLPGGSLPELRLTGFGANRSQLIAKLEAELRVPVRAFSPWPLVRWGSPPADLAPHTAALALALLSGGGSKAGLELEPTRQEELHRAPSLRLSAALAAALAAVLLALAVGAARRQGQALALADAEIRELKAQMTRVEAVDRLVREQRARLAYLESTVSARARQAEILREVTGLLPDSCYLSELTYRERRVEITGFAPSASQLLPALEGSPLFADVEFSAPIVAQGSGLERFRIRMRLERGADG